MGKRARRRRSFGTPRGVTPDQCNNLVLAKLYEIIISMRPIVEAYARAVNILPTAHASASLDIKCACSEPIMLASTSWLWRRREVPD